MDPARLSIPDLFKALETTAAGLSPDEARRRLEQYGPNSLSRAPGPHLFLRFLQQFTHFLAVLLWIAAGLCFLAEALQPGQGMATLGAAIVGVILINAIFSFIQEYKAERAVQALHRLLPETAWVIRSGQTQQVPRHDLVPGDVLLVEEGEQVPADGRLIEALHLRLDLSSLTGEAHPKRRTAEPAEVAGPEAPNLVFAGTTVVSGHGQAVVTFTGMRTEFGKIAHLATIVHRGLSPLQKEIIKVTRIVALLSVLMGATFFVIGLSTGLGIWLGAIFGIGILVANVPEGLLPTVTLALAMASQRMARRKALIKQLTSVETLGCATVICTDKTGTLTENRMRVERIVVNHEEHDAGTEPGPSVRERWTPLLQAMALCNNAKRVRGQTGRTAFAGDPTEAALLAYALASQPMDSNQYRRMGELPFDADRKRMTTLHWVEGHPVAFVKGAPESVVPLCTRAVMEGGPGMMTDAERERIMDESRHLAGRAYRVLAFATRTIEAGLTRHLIPETVERELTFLGLVGLMDPPHREVPDAIGRCRKAGIRVIMVTGDHPLTALAVARLIGLVPQDATESSVIDGARLDGMSEEDLAGLLSRPDPAASVFARMAPRHKLRIVSTLMARGEVVAVTGDGVNDAPALKKADIGVAMGMAGTDVAKATADMILLDDNFATIVNAVEEGRTVYANIKKFVTYVLSSNVAEVAPYLGYGLAGVPLALTIPQVLAVDLGTDMVPALALGAEPPDPGVMNEPPRPRTERLLSPALLLRTYLFLGLIEAVIGMSAFFWFLATQGWTWGAPLDWTDPLYKQATAVTFAAIVMAQVANVFACRSERISVFRLGFLTNRFILFGIGVELALLLLILYTPFGNFLLGTAPVPLWAWPALGAGAVGLLLAEEGRKRVIDFVRHRS
jgi:sodium/potassium-transporting ATPase subunit alpha